VSRRRAAGVAAGVAMGFALGAVLTLAIQGWATLPELGRLPDAPTAPRTEPQPPEAFLVWTSGGMPAGFREDLRRLDGITRSVVVASDNTWLDRSWSEQGEVIDDPPTGFAFPLEVAAVEPREFARFLPPADAPVALALADGQGILGESSARLRGLGPGAVMKFGDVRIEVAAILSDELVGAHELMVSREVGRSIGVTQDRYALVVPERTRTAAKVERLLDPILPEDPPSKVRAPGDTPYFRQGDAVLPPVRIKLLFGEFAARPESGRRGFLEFDPAWIRHNIDVQRVPLLGSVTCHVALFPQIRGVIGELVDRGLEETIHSFSGCFSPRHILADPTAGLSHHAWGIALDINVQQGNLFGETPHQDPRLVRVFERWGFVWGGTFIVPDGMHFEYHREPASD
jgi:D-alanyl-D-alanine carboxypeptidase